MPCGACGAEYAPLVKSRGSSQISGRLASETSDAVMSLRPAADGTLSAGAGSGAKGPVKVGSRPSDAKPMAYAKMYCAA